MAEPEIFGRTAEGEEVHRVEIAAGGLRAKLISWGAVLQDLRLEGHGAPLVLGFETFEQYPSYSPHFGAMPGRFANRIKEGRFILDGERFQTDQNQHGRHTLHGGSKGYSKRVLAHCRKAAADFVDLGACTSPDGEMGFPGNLDAPAPTGCKPAGTLSIEFQRDDGPGDAVQPDQPLLFQSG